MSDDSVQGPETEHEVWMLEEGEYMVVIGLYRKDSNGKPELVRKSEGLFQIRSQRDARYYFNQFIDLARRVKKLEKAMNRLF